jgi:hypothetical protein
VIVALWVTLGSPFKGWTMATIAATIKGTAALFIIILLVAAGVALAVSFPFQTLVVVLLAIIAVLLFAILLSRLK